MCVGLGTTHKSDVPPWRDPWDLGTVLPACPLLLTAVIGHPCDLVSYAAKLPFAGGAIKQSHPPRAS